MDTRLRDYIKKTESAGHTVQLIGFPSDRGVFINGGRQGSSKAPELIKAGLYNLTPHPAHFDKHTKLLEGVFDSGRIQCKDEVESDQKQLAAAVAQSLEKKYLPVIIGGGHETSYGHFLAYAELQRRVTIVNIDAHADVRELKEGSPHSGSPFRQALNHPSGRCSGYHVFGLNPATVSTDHYNFVNRHGSAHFEYETGKDLILNCLDRIEGDVMVTMDMDAVAQSEAPGVSAPNASGLRSGFWLDLAFEFGRHPKVASFDLCEVNPLYDIDNRTVRLAAQTIWTFLLGVSLRQGEKK